MIVNKECWFANHQRL